jgi:hypothetical protein
MEFADPNESSSFINIYFELLLAKLVDRSSLRKLNIVSFKNFCLFEYDGVEW